MDSHFWDGFEKQAEQDKEALLGAIARGAGTLVRKTKAAPSAAAATAGSARRNLANYGKSLKTDYTRAVKGKASRSDVMARRAATSGRQAAKQKNRANAFTGMAAVQNKVRAARKSPTRVGPAQPSAAPGFGDKAKEFLTKNKRELGIGGAGVVAGATGSTLLSSGNQSPQYQRY